MKLPWGSRVRVPREVTAAVTADGDRVLAAAPEEHSGGYAVAATAHLALVARDGSVLLRRGWSQVDAGVWEPRTGTLTISWVAGSRAVQWSFAQGAARFAEVFHERVSTSVVLAVPLQEGDRVIGRAAIRRDSGAGQLFPQLVWDRAAGGAAPGAQREAYGRVVLEDLCRQAGIAPPGGTGG